MSTRRVSTSKQKCARLHPGNTLWANIAHKTANTIIGQKCPNCFKMRNTNRGKTPFNRARWAHGTWFVAAEVIQRRHFSYVWAHHNYNLSWYLSKQPRSRISVTGKGHFPSRNFLQRQRSNLRAVFFFFRSSLGCDLCSSIWLNWPRSNVNVWRLIMRFLMTASLR